MYMYKDTELTFFNAEMFSLFAYNRLLFTDLLSCNPANRTH